MGDSDDKQRAMLPRQPLHVPRRPNLPGHTAGLWAVGMVAALLACAACLWDARSLDPAALCLQPCKGILTRSWR